VSERGFAQWEIRCGAGASGASSAHRSDIESRRLRRLPRALILGREIPVARGLRARLLGLALLPRERAGPGLLIPRCHSVHTAGMRFAIDVVFLDSRGRVLREVRGLPPCRLARCQGAAATLELPTERPPPDLQQPDV
jgi:uncharacterized protein